MCSTEPAAHACGTFAVRYGTGTANSPFGRPANSSGIWMSSKHITAVSKPSRIVQASSTMPYRRRPAAAITLSCGQTEPR